MSVEVELPYFQGREREGEENGEGVKRENEVSLFQRHQIKKGSKIEK